MVLGIGLAQDPTHFLRDCRTARASRTEQSVPLDTNSATHNIGMSSSPCHVTSPTTSRGTFIAITGTIHQSVTIGVRESKVVIDTLSSAYSNAQASNSPNIKIELEESVSSVSMT